MLNSAGRANMADVDRLVAVAERLGRHFDLGDYEVVQEIPVVLDAPLTSYHRALQALRDVRHMLPKGGVAIVDAVLDHAG